MKPTIIFKNKQQALSCLRYWQRTLSLQNWIIDINLDYNTPVTAPAWGSSSIWRAIHTAEINLPMPYEGQINRFSQRYIQELIVVHELLHVALPGYEADPSTTEGYFYENEEHARLELLAKGYIMARYNLDFNYFQNF